MGRSVIGIIREERVPMADERNDNKGTDDERQSDEVDELISV